MMVSSMLGASDEALLEIKSMKLLNSVQQETLSERFEERAYIPLFEDECFDMMHE